MTRIVGSVLSDENDERRRQGNDIVEISQSIAGS